jgi:hypothetical protein
VPPHFAGKLINKHEQRNIGPKGREKWNGVYFVNHQVEPWLQPAKIATEGMQMDRPLSSGSDQTNAVQNFLFLGAWKSRAEPLDLVAAGHKSFGNLVGKELRPPGLRIAGAAPVEDEDAHA